MTQFVGAVLGLTLCLLALHGARALIRSIEDRPDVHVSYLTQKCVRVVNGDGTPGSCAKLPERYNRIWVD